MRALKLATGALFVGGMVASQAAPALAGVDIPWTYNSGDNDTRGKFESYGEHVKGVEYNGSGYIDYGYGSNSGLRWYIPGSTDGTVKDLDLTITDGTSFKMQVCEVKTGLPDDCSAWKSGVS